MRIMSQGADSFSEAGKYGCATVEYAGMVSFNYLKRGGSALAAGASTISRSLASIKEGAGRKLEIETGNWKLGIVDWTIETRKLKLVLFKAKAANSKLMLLKGYTAKH